MEKDKIDKVKARIRKMSKQIGVILMENQASNNEAELLACYLLANVFESAVIDSQGTIDNVIMQETYIKKFNELLLAYLEECIE